MPAELIQHVTEHPPRCIARFQIDSASPLLKELPSREDVAYFALRCSCGSSAVGVLGHYVANESCPDEQVFVAPFALRCSRCGAVTELMDPRRDGYDAEIGECWSITGEGERSESKCSECGAQLMEVVVGFNYPVDDDDFLSEASAGFLHLVRAVRALHSLRRFSRGC
jgi:hypothetical protein